MSRERITRWFVWSNAALLVLACIILGLSWLAIIMACWGNLLTATVKSDVTGG